jgi:hypothetical protein
VLIKDIKDELVAVLRLVQCAIRGATDTRQIGKERVLSAGLSVHIQSDGFATEHSLRPRKRLPS